MKKAIILAALLLSGVWKAEAVSVALPYMDIQFTQEGVLKDQFHIVASPSALPGWVTDVQIGLNGNYTVRLPSPFVFDFTATLFDLSLPDFNGWDSLMVIELTLLNGSVQVFYERVEEPIGPYGVVRSMPDGGTTSAILGLGVLGLACVRRHFSSLS
jgi:hypothetical protein